MVDSKIPQVKASWGTSQKPQVRESEEAKEEGCKIQRDDIQSWTGEWLPTVEQNGLAVLGFSQEE